jgi:hypothetical protein
VTAARGWPRPSPDHGLTSRLSPRDLLAPPVPRRRLGRRTFSSVGAMSDRQGRDSRDGAMPNRQGGDDYLERRRWQPWRLRRRRNVFGRLDAHVLKASSASGATARPAFGRLSAPPIALLQGQWREWGERGPAVGEAGRFLCPGKGGPRGWHGGGSGGEGGAVAGGGRWLEEGPRRNAMLVLAAMVQFLDAVPN